MAEDKLQSLKDLIAEFTDLSLQDFRDSLQQLVQERNPTLDRYMLEQLKNWNGNRTMRAVIAASLAEREDENYLEDFAEVIEKETDVGLCKECISGLVKIGTPDALHKIEWLARSKPNATIASLLSREIEKIKQEEKEPATHYLDNLGQGNASPRLCLQASRVLSKMNDPKVVEELYKRWDSFDELSRTEASKVIAQVGQPHHLQKLLELMERAMADYKANAAFMETIEGFDQLPKDQRLAMLRNALKQSHVPEQDVVLDSFRSALENQSFDLAREHMSVLLKTASVVGQDYLMESLIQISDNKLAHAGKIHEEALRQGRVRHSRLRHLVAQLAYGLGRIGGQHKLEPEIRSKIVKWLTQLVIAKDNDISKMALYGTSFFVRPDDIELLDATLHCHQIEGMTRLINVLERKSSQSFADFFLKVSISHEILDIQEMAMRAMGDAPQILPKLEHMLNDSSPDTRKSAIRIIGEIRASRFLTDLIGLLEGQSDILRIEAITALGKFGDPTVLTHIEQVMLDAKSPMLIEVSLKAIAAVGGPAAMKLLQDCAEKSRNKKTAQSAMILLVDSFKNWSKPLPSECQALLITQLKLWFEERDATMRRDAFRMVGSVVSYSVEFYEALKNLMKEVSTKLRKESTWNKEEMALVEECIRSLNRNYFFLKEMQEFQESLRQRTRGHDNPSSQARMNTYEKLLVLLENNQKFVLSEDNTKELEKLVRVGLELGEPSWREQSICYKIAGFVRSPRLAQDLLARIKVVPKQARADLLDALTCMGMSLQKINDLTTIRKILVLEGSGFYRKRVVKYLSDNGYEVRDTDDLEIAISMVRSDVPDLIISEVFFLEAGDGAACLEKISEQYAGRITFIISTNVRDVGILERINKLKPKKVFHKPFNFEDLLAAIKSQEL